MALLAHLESTDATLSTDDLELNLMCLVADAWTPDEPIKNLWVCIKHLHAIANTGGDPLSDSTFMQLIVSALEQAGVSTQSIQTWRDRTSTEHTWANFCSHFIHGDKECLRMLTATTAGYHGAPAAIHTGGHTFSCQALQLPLELSPPVVLPLCPAFPQLPELVVLPLCPALPQLPKLSQLDTYTTMYN